MTYEIIKPTDDELFAALKNSSKKYSSEDEKLTNIDSLLSLFKDSNSLLQEWKNNGITLSDEGIRVDISSEQAEDGLSYAYTLYKEKGLDIISNLKGYLGEESFDKFARMSLGLALVCESKIADCSEFCTPPNRKIYPKGCGDGKTDGSLAGENFDCKYNTNPESTKVWVAKKSILADKLNSIHVGIRPCFKDFDDTIINLIKSGKTIPHMIYGYVDDHDVSLNRRYMSTSSKKGYYIQGRNSIYKLFCDAVEKFVK